MSIRVEPTVREWNGKRLWKKDYVENYYQGKSSTFI